MTYEGLFQFYEGLFQFIVMLVGVIGLTYQITKKK